MSERHDAAGSVSRMLRPRRSSESSDERSSVFGDGSFEEVEQSIQNRRSGVRDSVAEPIPQPIPEPERSPERDTAEERSGAQTSPQRRPAHTRRSIQMSSRNEPADAPRAGSPTRPAARGASDAEIVPEVIPEVIPEVVPETGEQQSASPVDSIVDRSSVVEALEVVVAAGELPNARKGYHLPEAVVWALEDLRTHYQRVERFSAREASHSNLVAAALLRYHEETFGRKVDL